MWVATRRTSGATCEKIDGVQGKRFGMTVGKVSGNLHRGFPVFMKRTPAVAFLFVPVRPETPEDGATVRPLLDLENEVAVFVIFWHNQLSL